MQLMKHGNCCGSKILYGFGRNYFQDLQTTRREKAQQIYRMCHSTTSGIISAILNRQQKTTWEGPLLDAGFTIVALDVPNPNMHNTTFLTHYQWVRGEAKKHYEKMFEPELAAKKAEQLARRREQYRLRKARNEYLNGPLRSIIND